jgi:hypothetical protein
MIIALSPLRLPGLKARMRRTATAPVPAPVTRPEDADAVRATMDAFMRHNVEMDRGQLETLMLMAEAR